MKVKGLLREGYIVKTKGEGSAIYLGGRFFRGDDLTTGSGMADIEDYTDDLKSDFDSSYNIDAIYRIVEPYADTIVNIIDNLPEVCVDCIWERSVEELLIDYSKLPRGTAVLVSDTEPDEDGDIPEEEWVSAFLYEYDRVFGYLTWSVFGGNIMSWKHCKLDPKVEIDKSWIKE